MVNAFFLSNVATGSMNRKKLLSASDFKMFENDSTLVFA